MKNTTRSRMGLGPVYPWRMYFHTNCPGVLTKYYASVHYAGYGRWATTCYTLEGQPGGWCMYLEDKRKSYNSLKAAKQAAREWCK